MIKKTRQVLTVRNTIKSGHYLAWRDGGNHRCTRVENPWEGVPEVCAKTPKGVKAFRNSPPISGYIVTMSEARVFRTETRSRREVSASR